jgi:L-alanine-DL-glutamate epimerase-like enolase superfamily enzyme
VTVHRFPAVEAVVATAYAVPTERPEADGTLSWDATTLVLVEIRAGEQVGLGWTYGAPACADVVRLTLAPLVVGRDPTDTGGAWIAMVDAVRNIGRGGIAGMALSAVDCAMWDLKARLLGLPLHMLLGAASEPVEVYGSGGFTNWDSEALTRQVDRWLAQGMTRVKIKIGQDHGRREFRDLERVAQVRSLVGPGVELFVDANGAYTTAQAVRIAAAMEAHDVRWFEEPVSSDDPAGLRAVRELSRAEVAAGEYGHDLAYLARLCHAGSVGCLQIDITRCGGLTEFLRAAAVAAAHGLQVSAHCAPNLHTPVLAAIPNARHVEWFHDHERIENLAFDGALTPSGGTVRPHSDRAGHGLHFRPAAVEPFRLP